MSDEADRRLLALFDALQDVPADERRGWIEARTADDPALRARAFRGLDGERAAPGAMRTGSAGRAPPPAPPPERIGAYRVTGLIGHGGMGAVYRGERDAGDFEHVVAIKLIRANAVSATLVERFRRERQTLARLVHPHIARLLDGGETADGQPYFIMEHVDGRPLGRWLGEARPDLGARLALFADVADAVGFAHRSLVVHRDITPDNILVTAAGEAKLIDFGIARPPATAGAGGAVPSRSLASLSLTPGFAAPERLAGGPATTLSDIYSLGVVLDRMTAGARDADLEAVVARATATDPAARYLSTDALADDLAAWRGGLPVAARGGGRRYRAGKFVRRHRLGVAAASAAALGLVAALTVSTLLYARAERARAAEAARFAEVRALARYMIFDLDARLARVIGNADARAGLVSRAQAYLSALAGQPEADAGLRAEAARGFLALARVQGVPTYANLGDYEQARANLARVAPLMAAGGLPRAVAVPVIVEADAMRALIQLHHDTEADVAGATLRTAEGRLAAVPEAERTPDWLRARSALRRSQLDRANSAKDLPAITRLAAMLAAEADGWPDAMRGSTAAAFDRAMASHYRGLHGYWTDALAGAVGAFRAADAGFGQLLARRPDDPTLLYWRAYNAYAGAGTAMGVAEMADQAAAFLAQARASVDRVRAIEPRDRTIRSLAGALSQVEAQALSGEGRHDAAIARQRDVLDLHGGLVAGDRRASGLNRLAVAEVTLANIAVAGGRRDVACAAITRAQARMGELKRRGALLGGVAHYEAGVADNVRRCAVGGAPAVMN